MVATVSPAAAQVLEVGAGGAVTRYDGPTTFDAKGSAPIRLSSPARRMLRRERTSGALLDAAAAAADLSPDLIEAVAMQESGLRHGAVSRAGATGEMQLMAPTARQLGVNPRVAEQNVHGGARYLRMLMNRYRGDVILTLAAYNAGPGAVDHYGGTPPYRETQAYVAAVLERLGRRAAEEGEAK